MATQRIVIRTDDVGMCHGANRAFVELSQLGTIGAGSVMVPCPWFDDLAEAAAADSSLDVGVHLTLNSEQRGYRWGPVSKPPPSAGLTDDRGYLWPGAGRADRAPTGIPKRSRPSGGRRSTRRSRQESTSPISTHTWVPPSGPSGVERYVAVGKDYGVPALITETLAAYDPNNHLTGTTEEQFAEFVEAARAAGMPVFGRVLETDFGRPRGMPTDYPGKLHSTDEALVYCAFHPCRPGPGEIEYIEPGAPRPRRRVRAVPHDRVATLARPTGLRTDRDAHARDVMTSTTKGDN